MTSFILGLSCSNWGFQTHSPVAHHGDANVHGDAPVPNGNDEDGAYIPEDGDELDFDVDDLHLATIQDIINDLAEELRPYGQPLDTAQATKAAEENVGAVVTQVA